MTATTLARPARSTRNKANQGVCLRAVLAYHGAIEATTKLGDLGFDAVSFEDWLEFTENREAECEQTLIDTLLVGGRPFEHEGFRYTAEPDEAGQTFILTIETL